ncbi:CRAL/TRIO domain-containing protein [Artomyces pyxidatus]|uniref:CRAL/TRIO domain-containing protein n=1 Tax=Artomyces pyxidatus TaxID=48021 RepID=A0ACB8TCN5_9AGAM|nr:CRAL/TRIO domain-containing protein [Artomyces pyxidatus]
MLKRHKFTATFALEALQTSLLWRLNDFSGVEPSSALTPDFISPLPTSARDILGRPILVLYLAALDRAPGDPRQDLLMSIELLRLQLRRINNSHGSDRYPVLQYTLLLDMSNVSMRSINVDLLTWYTREVVPQFPGMLAAVFMCNFSWTHSGVWNIIKHVLPESALSKVFFPSIQTLHQIIPPASLPKDYGGLLPSMQDLPRTSGPQNSLKSVVDGSAFPSTEERLAEPQAKTTSDLSPRSLFNPFFGYPVRRLPFPSSTLPYLHHGRQRKRDLLRTLAALWWEKWGSKLTLAFALFLALYLLRRWNQRRRLLRSLSMPKALFG